MPKQNRAKILILEDDELFLETLIDFLEESNFKVDSCKDGEDALDKSYENSYDLLLLDVNVPKLNGFEVLENIRGQNNNTPAIFLTSYRDKNSLLKGYNKGGDDYLKKPVDLDELLMKINVLLKRTFTKTNSIKIGNFTYFPEEKRLFCGQKDKFLSKKLSSLLELFIENKNRLITKEMIIKRLWDWDQEPSEGSLRVYINQLKNIIGKEMIQNQKGLGYRFEF